MFGSEVLPHFVVLLCADRALTISRTPVQTNPRLGSIPSLHLS